ncbi:MAG: hypothetical protein RL329_4072, partial [Bacteroidota bacterium]
MKIIIISLFCFFSLHSSQAQMDWTLGIYMRQSVSNTLAKGKLMELKTDFHYGFSNGVCLLGAFLERSNEVSINYSMKGGVMYAFIGGGDEDVTDLDITIQDETGKILKKDDATDNNPVVEFEPYKTATYRITLKLFNTHSKNSFCSIVFLQENAQSIPIDNLGQALGKLYAYGSLVNQKRSVKFLDLEQQWCLYGMVLAEGSAETVRNINLGEDEHRMIAAGDEKCTDIDICLLDSATQLDLKCDSDNDA